MCAKPLPGYQGHMTTNTQQKFCNVFLLHSVCEVVKGGNGEWVCLRNVRDKGTRGGCMRSLIAQFIWLIDHFVDFIR